MIDESYVEYLRHLWKDIDIQFRPEDLEPIDETIKRLKLEKKP